MNLSLCEIIMQRLKQQITYLSIVSFLCLTAITSLLSAAEATPAGGYNYVTIKERIFRPYWNARIGSTSGNHGSPVTTADGTRVVVATTGGNLRCLDQDGHIEWKKDKIPPVGAPGLIADIMLNGQKTTVFFVGSLDGIFMAFDLASGREIWRTESQGGAVLAKPYFENEPEGAAIYFATEKGKFFKLSAVSGEKIWSYTHKGAVQEMTVRGHTPVVSLPDLPSVYVGLADGYLLALAKKSGIVTFKAMLAKKDISKLRFTDVDASPVFGGEIGKRLIYAASYNGGLFALDANNGMVLWNHDEYQVSSIVNTGNSLIISQPSGLVSALDYQGFTIWETAFKSGQTGEMLFMPSENMVLLPTTHDGILTISLKDGRPLHSIDVGGEFCPELAIGGEFLYFMTAKGLIYAFAAI